MSFQHAWIVVACQTSKKDYRQLVGTLFRKESISYHLWFSHSEF